MNVGFITNRVMINKLSKIVDVPDYRICHSLSLHPEHVRFGEGGMRIKGYHKHNVPDKPLVSVIIIVLNHSAGVEKTIQSVICQQYDNIEIIVVDGGSTDGTVDIIRQYEDVIDYWVSESDSGISEAFNKGILLSRGEWLQFLNAGDILMHERVMNSVAGHFTGKHYIITGQVRQGSIIFPKKVLSNQDRLYRRAWISHQASWIHRQVFETMGCYSEEFKIRMDYEFWLRALKHFDFEFLNEVLVDYEEGGLSGRRPLLFCVEECRANRMHLERSTVANMIAWAKYAAKSILCYVK